MICREKIFFDCLENRNIFCSLQKCQSGLHTQSGLQTMHFSKPFSKAGTRYLKLNLELSYETQYPKTPHATNTLRKIPATANK